MSQPVLSTIEGTPCPTTIEAAFRSLPLPDIGDEDDDDNDDDDDDDDYVKDDDDDYVKDDDYEKICMLLRPLPYPTLPLMVVI